jgi:cytosine/adenosine deaminase-related metal-dependent hydrolase
MLDWSHISRTPEHADAAIKGLRDSGIRAVYSHGAPGSPDYWGGSSKGHPQDIRRIRKEVLSDDAQLVTLGMSARAPGAVTDEVIKADWALARELGLRISVHAGYRRHRHHHQHIADLARLGALGPDTTCIHCTDSSDAELDLLAASGAFTSVAPYVEMLMGHGMPPTGKLLKRGIRPSLSIDVASSVPGDMFTQMRTALVAERILAMTATPDEKFAPTLTHKDVLEFATLQGARALGMAQTIGSLEVGKHADVVLLDTRKVNTQPVVDPEGTVVVYADTANIDTVMVGGVIRKRHGQLVATRLSDDFRLLNNSRDYLLNAAGMKGFNV